MKPFITADNLSIGYIPKRHPPQVVSQDISLHLNPGELVCLVGPNGCGKSTLIRTITGLQPSLSGVVNLAGRNISTYSSIERAQLIALVLTTPVQAGQLKVYDLIGLGRYPYTDWVGSLTKEDHHSIRKSLSLVGIESFSQRFMHELSDGERQKVMIARALTQSSHLIILDEPTAFLDFPYRIEILSMLREITRREKKGILLSSHDLDLAMRLADRLWIMNRNGKFHAGAPEDLILNGSISDVFSTQNVQFDSDNGQFTVPSACKGSFLISGENGKTRFWTMRALRRIGYQIDDEKKPMITIHITTTPTGLCWNVFSSRGEASFMNLTDLTQWIEDPRPGAV